MLRLHHAAVTYSALPSDIVGFERGSWHAWIVIICAQRVGDEARAAMVQRAGMVFPTVAIQ